MRPQGARPRGSLRALLTAWHVSCFSCTGHLAGANWSAARATAPTVHQLQRLPHQHKAWAGHSPGAGGGGPPGRHGGGRGGLPEPGAGTAAAGCGGRPTFARDALLQVVALLWESRERALGPARPAAAPALGHPRAAPEQNFLLPVPPSSVRAKHCSRLIRDTETLFLKSKNKNSRF